MHSLTVQCALFHRYLQFLTDEDKPRPELLICMLGYMYAYDFNILAACVLGGYISYIVNEGCRNDLGKA